MRKKQPAPFLSHIGIQMSIKQPGPVTLKNQGRGTQQFKRIIA